MSQLFTVLTGEWCHETNTFSVLPTTRKNFYDQYYLETPEDILKYRQGTKTVIGATFEAAERYGWNLITTISASANPSGTIVKETFEYMTNQIVNPCKEKKIDGILLHLHGAMVSEEYEDAEGELLKRVREVVGPTIPIIVTLDLHGNITETMTKNSTSLIAVRTYPHIDFYEIAQRAADMLQSIMLGEIIPVTAIAKGPLLFGLDGGKTHPESPMYELIKRGEILEETKECLVVSVCAGFTAADIYDIGPSITVTVDVKRYSSLPPEEAIIRAQSFAQGIADEFMKYAWETRHYKSEIHRTIPEVIQYSLEYLQKQPSKPLVIADVTDNPGSGHYGDATDLLRGIVHSEITDVIFYAIFDPNAVLTAQEIGVGKEGTITLGGNYDPTCGGGPLTLTAKVVSLTDGCFQTFGPMGFGGMWQNYGLSALIRTSNNIDIVLITNNGQLLDIAQITSMGCDPVHKKVICVKSKHHFRAALGPIAGEIITVDGGGLGSVILACGEYKRVRRPIYPIDKELC